MKLSKPLAATLATLALITPTMLSAASADAQQPLSDTLGHSCATSSGVTTCITVTGVDEGPGMDMIISEVEITSTSPAAKKATEVATVYGQQRSQTTDVTTGKAIFKPNIGVSSGTRVPFTGTTTDANGTAVGPTVSTSAG